jgi:8-oxo-dGTP pyrophosphatase MutT (NUDIX family)
MSHIHEKYDFVISAYIVHVEKVLLINHKKLKKWLPVGGHIELNEDPQEALFREIREEAGISADNLELISDKPNIISAETKFLFPPTYLDVHEITEKHKHIGLVYFLRSITDVIKLAENEHEDIRWFTEAEIDNSKYYFSNATKFYIKEAFRICI